ncbi:hypothetical protein AYK25_10270 [Thermoplasmatales archaeon SM1-50]|nr:MAG: hypothetical protein AYK25_10270 [Thermoplasmatales archaeon SM1-50]
MIFGTLLNPSKLAFRCGPICIYYYLSPVFKVGDYSTPFSEQMNQVKEVPGRLVWVIQGYRSSARSCRKAAADKGPHTSEEKVQLQWFGPAEVFPAICMTSTVITTVVWIFN